MRAETNSNEQVETRTVREEPAPLVMKKTRTRKEDGRELIYYEFYRPGEGQLAPSPQEKGPAVA
jgi:hypothetical protein